VRQDRFLRWLRPSKPELDPDETLLREFVGPFARVTLTEKRIIISRRAHKSIDYDDVEAVSGGWGASNARYVGEEHTTMPYGFYLQTADYNDSSFIVGAKDAARMVKESPVRPPCFDGRPVPLRRRRPSASVPLPKRRMSGAKRKQSTRGRSARRADGPPLLQEGERGPGAGFYGCGFAEPILEER
jgi:hypothetical protein